MSATQKAKQAQAKPPPLTTQEIQQNYNRFQSELQGLASKIGELEQEAEEHGLVLATLDEALADEPGRKCFRLVGGVLVERTVKDVVPALQHNKENISKAISTLSEQYKVKEEELDTFKREYNIIPATAG
ncbi:Prefoldin beta-like protein [Laetiporus sulphureus 93-53]|uniref:Prefoldin beta-like protein n=1 Tax=Laetiporus sulphureus 93-53 TaxID=1314785 RepID=A0A165E7Q8_9APHY|nr:Prefoldin beta-like protein [Laetiporus sulphureus 93-53]KZT06402.1 Prefoldin beta-like protein [Laetiporus sulphureus 93-53]